MTATLTSLPSHAWTPPPLSWITHSSNSAGLIAIRACSLSCLQLLQHDAAVSAAVVWFGFCASYSRSTVTHASTLPIQWLPKVFQKHCKMQKKKIWCMSQRTKAHNHSDIHTAYKSKCRHRLLSVDGSKAFTDVFHGLWGNIWQGAAF